MPRPAPAPGPHPSGPVAPGEECGTEAFHGTSSGYTYRKCRGNDCRDWNRKRKPRKPGEQKPPKPRASRRLALPGQGAVEMGKNRVTPGPGELVASCWCDQSLLGVPVEMIREGKTRSCGRPGCHEA